MKRNVVVFDFDGTIIKKDSFLEFVKFACGFRLFCIGFLLYSPLLFLMKLKIFPNWKAKQMLFGFFFKGEKYETFCEKGKNFSKEIDEMLNEDVLRVMHSHLANGDTVYVISASVEDWIKPWCDMHGVNSVLATKIQVDSCGFVTGKFSTKNCYGMEKVHRLLEREPNRDNYFLYAYGDSRGDKEMLKFADQGCLIK